MLRARPPSSSAGASPASSVSSDPTAPMATSRSLIAMRAAGPAAVDGTVGLRNSYGLSVCLRLLALVDLLARVRWADPLCLLRRDGADLHPSLLGAAASMPLTAEARFDEFGFRSRLARFGLRLRTGRPAAQRLTGATS